MFKFCNTCKTEKSIQEFNYKNTQKQIRQSRCKDCQKIDKNYHYLKNKTIYIERATENKKLVREWWQEYKKQFKCPCGESHPACIEFHHVNDDKDADVSQLFSNGSIKKGLKELQKCIPICSNCHKKLHYGLRNSKQIS